MNPNLGWSGARKSPANDFADFLDIILPARNGRLAVLNAYFDASSRTSGIFSLAGVAFAKPQVKKFDKEWWKLFEIGRAHV